jgi:hypothetical protein
MVVVEVAKALRLRAPLRAADVDFEKRGPMLRDLETPEIDETNRINGRAGPFFRFCSDREATGQNMEVVSLLE